MAHHTATLKAIRQSGARRARNLFRLTRLRNSCKKVELAVQENDVEAAKTALHQAQRDLMRAAQKDVIKKNQASRKLSRLNAQVKAIAVK